MPILVGQVFMAERDLKKFLKKVLKKC